MERQQSVPIPCQMLHATTLKVACKLLPYFINMLQCNFNSLSIIVNFIGIAAVS